MLEPLDPNVIHWVRSAPMLDSVSTPYPYHIGPDLKVQKEWLDAQWCRVDPARVPPPQLSARDRPMAASMELIRARIRRPYEVRFRPRCDGVSGPARILALEPTRAHAGKTAEVFEEEQRSYDLRWVDVISYTEASYADLTTR